MATTNPECVTVACTKESENFGSEDTVTLKDKNQPCIDPLNLLMSYSSHSLYHRLRENLFIQLL